MPDRRSNSGQWGCEASPPDGPSRESESPVVINHSKMKLGISSLGWENTETLRCRQPIGRQGGARKAMGMGNKKPVDCGDEVYRKSVKGNVCWGKKKTSQAAGKKSKRRHATGEGLRDKAVSDPAEPGHTGTAGLRDKKKKVTEESRHSRKGRNGKIRY